MRQYNRGVVLMAYAHREKYIVRIFVRVLSLFVQLRKTFNDPQREG